MTEFIDTYEMIFNSNSEVGNCELFYNNSDIIKTIIVNKIT